MFWTNLCQAAEEQGVGDPKESPWENWGLLEQNALQTSLATSGRSLARGRYS